MKARIKIIIATFLWGTHVVGYAQNFIDEDKQWSIVSHLFESEKYITTTCKFSGDSAINGQTYYKLYQTTDLNQASWTLNSLWREKNDSVFTYDFVTGGNHLIYDFNLNVGDTFVINESQRLKVDSVVFRNWGGISKKHWYLSDADGVLPTITVWVEGVGQMGYFIRSTEIDITGAFVELLCFHENGNLLYQNPGFESCYVNVGVKEIADLNLPVTVETLGGGNVRILCNESKLTGQIHFYNLLGQKVLSIKPNGSDGSEIICHLPDPGIYLYNFLSTNSKIVSGKVFVK